MIGKKFMIAMAAMSIFNLSTADVNFDSNFTTVSKVYAATNQELAEKKAQEGWELFANDDAEGAIKKYNEAIQLNPNYEVAYYLRGRCYFELKKYDKAIADYNKAMELNPNFLEPYAFRGYIYDNLKKYDEAIADFTKCIEINPELANAYFERGCIYKKLGKYDKALADFKKITELKDYKDRNDSYYTNMSYVNLGDCYAKLKKYDEAIATYKKALEISPSFINPQMALANLYYDLKRYDEALEYLTKMIEYSPDNGEYYYKRGTAYKALGKNDLAKKDFATAKALGYKA